MNTENKLIAEFMGNNYSGVQGYSDSWDWLMPVVEKCVTLNDAYELDGHEQVNNAIQDALWTINIEEVYQAVVEFIKWFNENK